MSSGRGPLLLLTLVLACSDEAPSSPPPPVTPACSGDVLFGRPNETTGLGGDRCQPRCTCGGEVWEPPEYTASDADALLAWQLLDPPAPLEADPYGSFVPPAEAPELVCGVLPDPPGSHSYRLVTYGSEAEAVAAGALPTHFGACGVCSPLVDLAVYMRENDLTAPVRQCALDNLTGTEASHIQCLQDLGFDYACAQIWYFNTIHTRDECSAPCFATLGDPYHLPDGSLNACLACDEEKSGPVFKAVAGRTRRNTGLPNALCRPCSEVRPLVHDYP